MVGDGEAETGPLATAWHSNKFLNPASDGAVLPILHLNGYKIANPTVLARISHEELESSVQRLRLSRPISSKATSRWRCTRRWRRRSTRSSREIKTIQNDARTQRRHATAALADDRPALAQGLDGPEEGRRRAGRRHLALASGADRRHAIAEHLKLLEDWMRSYRPEELFDSGGTLMPELAGTCAQGQAPHGRESPRQRRPVAARSAHAGLSRLRGRGPSSPASW